MRAANRIDETTVMTIGLLHPGEMGAAIGAAVRASGQTVLWASRARSAATAERATQDEVRSG